MRYWTILATFPLAVTACANSRAPAASPPPASVAAAPANAATAAAATAAAATADRTIEAAATGPAFVERMASFDEFVRTRCATDGSATYTTWTGKIFAFVPGERQRLLFHALGMNVARCQQSDAGRWLFTSRELMYYLDPESGEVLDRWLNPWTEETVPVVHVANSPVQGPLRRPVPVKIARETAIFALDVPLYFPSVLGQDQRFDPYSAAPNYQAGEFFTFMAPAREVENSALKTVSQMTFSWHRHGQWLPWMKMGGRPGNLVYSAHGTKVDSYEDLPAHLRQEIDTRLPLYKHPPSCLLDQPNQTSWTYFGNHFADYLAGARFPLPAPIGEESCAPAQP